MISTEECRWVLVIIFPCPSAWGASTGLVMSNDRRAEPIVFFIVLWLIQKINHAQRLFCFEITLIQLLYLMCSPNIWQTLNARNTPLRQSQLITLVYLSGFQLWTVTSGQMPALDRPPLRQPVWGPLGNRISIRQAAVLLGLNWGSPRPQLSMYAQMPKKWHIHLWKKVSRHSQRN